jgi:hypothetical protein
LKNRFYVIAMPVKKYNDGNDFVLDTVPFFKKHGYTIHNTRTGGVLRSFFIELYLLCKIKKNATVVTTWPGFPKIVINDFFYLNHIRIFLFNLILKFKKWDYVVIPIDLHLLNAKARISNRSYENLVRIEESVFRNTNKFIACGDALFKKFKNEYPLAEVYKMDMYDQVLPAFEPIKKIPDKNRLKIVVLGNLVRMLDNVHELPEASGISYWFIGKNGEELEQFNRPDLHYLGELPDEELLKTLNEFDFGLIFYSRKVDFYFSNVISGKTTSYLYAGLPVLCPKQYKSIAALVEEKKVGAVIYDLQKLPETISQVLPAYQQIRKNCLAESDKIREFKHYEESLEKAGLI